MTRTVEELIGRLTASELAAVDAYRQRDIPKHNRWIDRAAEAAETLVQSSSGRHALEELMRHDSPSVRCAAAARVLNWSPATAVPVLEDLLLWAWNNRTGDLFGESIQVRGNAKGLLFVHLGIDILKIDDYVRAKHALPPKKRPQWAP